MNKPKLDDYTDEDFAQEFGAILKPKSKIITRSVSHKEYYYPFEGEITDFESYRDLVEILLTANAGDVVRIFINSNGGRIDVADMIVSRISEAQQREVQVIAELGFTVASAATYIALSCDDIIVSPNCQFLVHCWTQWGGYGQTTYLVKDIEFSHKQSVRFMKDTYQGFLTEDEVEDLLAHPRDLSFDAEEVVERWDNMMQYRQEQLQKMIDELKAQQEADSKPVKKPTKKKAK